MLQLPLVLSSKLLMGLWFCWWFAVASAASASGAAVSSSPGLRLGLGQGQLGDACMQRYSSTPTHHLQQQHQVYEDIPNAPSCQLGSVLDSETGESYTLTCHVAPNDTGMIPLNGVVELEGTCEKAACVGTAVSTSAGIAAAAAAERITICHFNTNEETAQLNPWIRMTVDKQAWESPSNLCEFTQQDFVVQEHVDIANRMAKGEITDFLSEQDYWNYWEPACPFVRQDPNHPQRCCQGSDCCTQIEDQPQDQQQEASSDSRILDEFEECPEDPTESYTQDIYITFMGEPGLEDYSLEEHLTLASTDIDSLEDSIKTQFNYWGGDGKCVYFSRLIHNVTIDPSTSVPAMNKDYDLVGFRIRATVQGLCEGCNEHLFLPSDNCKETQESLCAVCMELSNDDPGFIKQIPGMELYARVNEALSLENTSAEIFRMQGDVTPESPACDSTQSKYLEATGEVVCL
jgi:hypothetical protein